MVKTAIKFTYYKIILLFILRYANLPRKGPSSEFGGKGKGTLPKMQHKMHFGGVNNRNFGTISQFFTSTNCLVDCGRQTKDSVCSFCQKDPQRAVLILETKAMRLERGLLTTLQLCQACCGRVGDISCDSLDCPVRFVLERKRRDTDQMLLLRCVLEDKF